MEQTQNLLSKEKDYSVNIEDNYIYYSDSNKKLYRTKIGSNVEETLYDNIETYNLNTNDGYAYYLNYVDAENADYTVCLYRVKLDGSTQTPENLKEMETYSSFIDIVGNWVIYMDSSEEAGFINLVNKDGKGDEIELYRLNYSEFYEDIEDQMNSSEEGEEVVEDVEEITETTTEEKKEESKAEEKTEEPKAEEKTEESKTEEKKEETTAEKE